MYFSERISGIALIKGLLTVGSSERSMRFRPPLTIQKNQIDEGLDILRASLMEMKA